VKSIKSLFYRKFLLALFFIPLVFVSSLVSAQTGKDGSLTVTSDTVLNSYTKVVADVSSGDTSIQVMSVNQLIGIDAGDLIMIIQMQGASMNSSTNDEDWGEVTSLNNAGNYELAYVSAIDSFNNVLYVCTPLSQDYSESGNAQVVLVPQYTSLTVDPGASIQADGWNGITGGVVMVHATGTVTINGEIDAEGAGFRGGVRDNFSSSTATNIVTSYYSSSSVDGAEKGEGIAGFYAEYDAAGGRYGRGAPANAGGGGNGHNSGGGGGANAGVLANYNGFGVMNTSATGFTAYQLDPAYTRFGGYTTSSGGGTGGYSFSFADRDALTEGPSDAVWTGDYRDTVGGRGGRPIDGYALEDRVFLGGGGGAGDGNNTASFDGANGGGIVFIIADQVTGSGTINANGKDGQRTLNAGNDSPGGAGGGGSVLIDAATSISNLTISADGGQGGFQYITSLEAEGPGGGGGGGVIAVTSPSNSGLSLSAAGGLAGVTNSASLTEFPNNGATDGGDGDASESISASMPTYSCALADADGDTQDNFEDIDADNDGIVNNTERDCSSTTYIGTITSVNSETNITNSSNITGASDGSYARFEDATSTMVVQLDDELPYGSIINIVWRAINTAGAGAEVAVELSADNSSFDEHEARYFRTNSTSAVTITIPVTDTTEYIRLTQSYNQNDDYDFEIDAIYYSYTTTTCNDPDTDGDGVLDYLDLDADNDGLTDLIEAGGVDTDGDGVADDLTDTDGDGHVNTYDLDNGGVNLPNEDKDGDGNKDYLDVDADDDGIPDLVEAGKTDSDGNGTIDGYSDADGDGYSDNVDPNDDGVAGIDAGEANQPVVKTTDSGSDGLTDNWTDGSGNPYDTDGDGWVDHLDIDSDDDGMTDNTEGQTTGGHKLPAGTDTDGDGLDDSYDTDDGGYRVNPTDTDKDGTPDYIDTDSDDDGESDSIESYDTDNDGTADTSPTAADIDNDGLDDGYDDNIGSVDPTDGNEKAYTFPDDDPGQAGGQPDWRDAGELDTDGDGIPDIDDIDDDNDGIMDTVETAFVQATFSGGQSGTVSYGGISGSYALTQNAANGYGSTSYSAGSRGIEILHASNAGANPDSFSYSLSFSGITAGYLPQIRLYQNGGGTTGNNEASDYILNWTAGPVKANAYLVDTLTTTSGSYDSGIPGSFDLDNREVEGLNDTTALFGGDSIRVFAMNHDVSQWFVQFPLAVSNITVNKVVLRNGTAATTSSNPADGIDGLYPMYGYGSGAPGESYQEWMGFSVYFLNDNDADSIANSIDLDSDNDGILDIVEAGGVDVDRDGQVDDPTDTDGDGLADAYDTDNGGTTISYGDSDSDGVEDAIDVDSDNDGIYDVYEAQATTGYTAPAGTDADDDGIDDNFDDDDTNFGGLSAAGFVPVNTDASGDADYLDTDSDGDEVPDKQEAWDALNDGDSEPDGVSGSCTTDSDGDGLVDCFDSNDSDKTDFTISITPPSDDASGGTNGANSTGVDHTASNELDDVFPANDIRGGADNTEPDFRDTDNANCSSASTWYAVTDGDTTNDYHWTGVISSQGANTSVVRATAYCQKGSWYRFYNPQQPDSYILAIQNNTNTEPLENVINYIEVKTTDAPKRTDDGTYGLVLMRRAWFINAKGNLNGSVNIRFYYPATEYTVLQDSADQLAFDLVGATDYQWFKSDDEVDYSSVPTQFSGYSNNFINLNSSVSATNSTDSDAGGGSKNYVQIDGITSFSGGTFGSQSNGPLAAGDVDLLAVLEGNDVYLDWTSFVEDGASYYSVERSTDGHKFESIARVDAKGYSQTPQNYSYVDEYISSSKLYYQVKMVNLDGSIKESQVVEVSTDVLSIDFKAFPNPMTDELQLEYKLPQDEMVTVKIIDQLGKEVYSTQLMGYGKKEQLLINSESWSSGIYQIMVHSLDGAIYQEKISKK
jgi:hypothetical protein